MPGGGSKKGERRGGRGRGTKNKATLERERQAQLEVEKAALLAKAEAAGSEVLAAQAEGKKLMKQIAFDFAQLFAGIAAFHQPYPGWHQDASGKWVNDNPNYDEARFRDYGKLAVDTALGAASYESPKLSAVMVGAAVVTQIKVEGGIPDDQDGGLFAAEIGSARTIELTGPDVRHGRGGAADAPPGAGEGAPGPEQAEGAEGRKALG
jgi:hypothetical protein